MVVLTAAAVVESCMTLSSEPFYQTKHIEAALNQSHIPAVIHMIDLFAYSSQMAPLKKSHQANLKNKGLFIDVGSADSQSLECPLPDSTKTRVRSSNWSPVMDSAMLNVMMEEHALGNFVNGSFTPLAWIKIVRDFNERTKLGFTKVHLQNRLKVLKKQYLMYQTLANKSGWGWDYAQNIPTAGDPSDWDAIITENPAYAKCRDKPFPAYQSIEFLTGKCTATGRHGVTSRMDVEEVRSTSSSSPATQPIDMENLRKNLEDVNDANSTSPTTTPIKVGSHKTGSASCHTSSLKRPRVSPPNPTPTSNRRRINQDGRTQAIHDLVELGKKRTEIAQTIMERELQARPKLHSIEECMERLSNVAHLTPDGLLAVCEALKDERNRPIFMTLNGDMLGMWIDQQIAMHQFYTGQRPVAPSFNPTASFFPAASASFNPGLSFFPQASAGFPLGTPSFPPTGPSNSSNLPSFSSERPSFPPN